MKKIKINGMQTSSTFLSEIEELVREKKIPYLDAIMHYCEKNEVEIETAASLIKMSTKMKGKLRAEAKSLNLLKK